MARLFITDKELLFMSKVTKEVLQHTIGQEVYYYGISLEHSNPHRLYEEEVNKVTLPAVKMNAMVNWDNPNTVKTKFGADSKFKLEVEFDPDELIDRNVNPQEGDFIEYGQVFFEITSITHPRTIFGQINNKVATKCFCIPSREGQFQAGSDSSKNIDNSHPVENKICTDD